MELLELNDWDEFQESLRILKANLEKASEGRSRDLSGVWVYRGQSNHAWELQTTLERHDPNLVE